MTPLPLRARVYLIVVVAMATVLLGKFAALPPSGELYLFLGFAAATIAMSLFKLRLPFALPHIFTGLRIAAGLAVIGAIVGEFITSGGIGGAIIVARQQNRVDKVFAGLLLASVLGIALFALINFTSRVSLRHWHASEQEGK